jgi:hypothetical protein
MHTSGASRRENADAYLFSFLKIESQKLEPDDFWLTRFARELASPLPLAGEVAALEERSGWGKLYPFDHCISGGAPTPALPGASPARRGPRKRESEYTQPVRGDQRFDFLAFFFFLPAFFLAAFLVCFADFLAAFLAVFFFFGETFFATFLAAFLTFLTTALAASAVVVAALLTASVICSITGLSSSMSSPNV